MFYIVAIIYIFVKICLRYKVIIFQLKTNIKYEINIFFEYIIVRFYCVNIFILYLYYFNYVIEFSIYFLISFLIHNIKTT